MSIYEVYNEDGIKQFDADQVPMILRRKVTLDASLDVGRQTMGGNTSNRTVVWNSQTITVDEPDAVIAFCGPVYAKMARRSGNQWSVAYQRSSASDHTLEIYIFATGSTGTMASPFVILNEDGTIVLTAEDLPMRVIGGATYAIADQPYQIQSVSLPGVKLAGILTASAQVRETIDDIDDDNNDRQLISQTFLYAHSSTVSNLNIVYNTLRIPVDETAKRAINTGSFVAIDVTGF